MKSERPTSPKESPDELNESSILADVGDVSTKSIALLEASTKLPDAKPSKDECPSDDISASFVDVDEPTSPKMSIKSPEVRNEDDGVVTPLDEKSRELVKVIATQKVDNRDLGFEKVDENSQPEVAPIAKPEVPDKSATESEKADSEIESKIRTVRSKASALLAQWDNLQEVFKIPKREMFSLRTKHEAEVDRAAAAANEVSKTEAAKLRPVAKPAVSQSSYERGNPSFRFSVVDAFQLSLSLLVESRLF